MFNVWQVLQSHPLLISLLLQTPALLLLHPIEIIIVIIIIIIIIIIVIIININIIKIIIVII